jgi:hypothetical protein
MCSTADGGSATNFGLSNLEIDGRSIANFQMRFPSTFSSSRSQKNTVERKERGKQFKFRAEEIPA